MWRYVMPLIAAMSIAAPVGADQGNDAFAIRRGTNISHWLSQSTRRGPERTAFFTEKDVQYIASLGFDHIRLPVDEEQLWDEAGAKEPEAFALMHSAIGWARAKNLRVIVDLHILRSHHFNATDKPLWTDPKAQDKFLALWRDLSAELAKYPLSLVAYELMNEPVADNAEDWNRLVEKAMRQIRRTEPHRKIVIGSNKWQSVGTFDQLRIPEGDRDIILSFHFYTPMLLTHYRASWTSVGKYQGPVNYPGMLVDPVEIEKLDPEVAKIVKSNNGVWDREKLEAQFAKPLALAQKLDLPLYCGEWGAISGAPQEARLRWYRDMRANLEKHGIAWATWDYKGGFGIIGRGGQPNEDMIGALLGKQ